MALCAAISIEGGGDVAPEWVHLLPAGEARTHDGRGPYRLVDPAAVIAASLATGAKLVLDENHATDLAAPQGLPAPAQAWITELQSRADGIWGRVDWVDPDAGVWRHYRGISPAIVHARDGTVLAIARASLTNLPNITGLTALHAQEKTMDFRAALLEALSLGGDADDAAIIAAIKAMKGADPVVALNAALAPIALAAGLTEGADAAAVLAGVQQLAGDSDARVTALQSELAQVTTSLNAVMDQQRRDKAATFVDAAIAAGRVGIKPQRDRYIAMHMRDAGEAETLIGAMPILPPGARTVTAPARTEGDADSPALLAQKAGAYQRKLAAEGVTITIASAVRAVQEGKAA